MKTLYLVRGLPGSGKTTLARKLAPDAAFAADDYFEANGGYEGSKLPQAHRNCLQNVLAAMKAGRRSIAVHNTFSQNWEMSGYKECAWQHGYSVFVLECQNFFGSVHSVPVDVVQGMIGRWEYPQP